jgi:hypothetical protein
MDEMPRRYYNEYVTALSELGRQHAGFIQTLYSCRINDFSPAFRHRQLVLMPFTSRQIREYVAARFPSGIHIDGRPFTADSIWRYITTEDFFLEVTNPLILSLLMSYLDDERRWPDSISLLFDRYLRRNYAKISAKRSFNVAAEYWSAIAFSLTQKDSGASIAVSESKDWAKPEGRASIEDGILCGVLMDDQPETTGIDITRRVRFSHHRMQEYLTAYYLKNHPVEMNWLQVLDEPRWQQTILNLAVMQGHTPASETLGQWLSQFVAESQSEGTLAALEDEHYARLAADRVELAALVLREVGVRLPIQEDPLRSCTEPSIALLMKHGNPITQVKMLSACRLIRHMDFYKIAEPALKSRVAWVRNQALMVAARFDTINRTVSEAFSMALASDVHTGRFVQRLPAYITAIKRTGNRSLRAHVFIAALSVTIRILAASLIVMLLNILIVMLLNDVMYPLQPISLLQWLQWGVIPLVAGACWYFVILRAVKPETTILIAGIVYLAAVIALPNVMDGQFEYFLLSLAICELLLFGPIIIFLISVFGTWVYRVGIFAIGGDSEPASLPYHMTIAIG